MRCSSAVLDPRPAEALHRGPRPQFPVEIRRDLGDMRKDLTMGACFRPLHFPCAGLRCLQIQQISNVTTASVDGKKRHIASLGLSPWSTLLLAERGSSGADLNHFQNLGGARGGSKQV